MRYSARRRHDEAVHKKRLLAIAKGAGGYPGPWYNKEKARVENPGRGKRSKYLKRMANKAVRRRADMAASPGGYKKVFDYWWELT